MTLNVFAENDTTTFRSAGTEFNLVSSGNNQLLVFLHGGINHPIFDSSSGLPIAILTSGNTSFIATSLQNNFDVLLPVTNDSMDWLVNHEYCHSRIQHVIDSLKTYNSVCISGYSDGGTGSYKIFYTFPGDYDGLVCFNGYPQHKNFNKKVDYSRMSDKKVVFLSTTEDKVIPYEFLLTEYCKQKQTNSNTFLKVCYGGHAFGAYQQEHFDLVFDVLNSKIQNSGHESIHGFVRNDEVVEFYAFRKKICRKYGYGESYFEENKKQAKTYGDLKTE